MPNMKGFISFISEFWVLTNLQKTIVIQLAKHKMKHIVSIDLLLLKPVVVQQPVCWTFTVVIDEILKWA